MNKVPFKDIRKEGKSLYDYINNPTEIWVSDDSWWDYDYLRDNLWAVDVLPDSTAVTWCISD